MKLGRRKQGALIEVKHRTMARAHSARRVSRSPMFFSSQNEKNASSSEGLSEQPGPTRYPSNWGDSVKSPARSSSLRSGLACRQLSIVFGNAAKRLDAPRYDQVKTEEATRRAARWSSARSIIARCHMSSCEMPSGV